MSAEISRRQLKKILLEALQQQELPEIFKLISAHQEHQLLNPLFIALCHREEKVRFRAVRCFGQIVPTMADKDLEAARTVMRRFLWSLNDESGGIGWGAPEAMAEIMCHSEILRQEYLHMLISYMREDGEELFQDGNYIELPMLQRGVLWGVGRLSQCHRDEMIDRRISGDVAAYLGSPDPQVAGMAIWCLGMLGRTDDSAKITPFLGNETKLTLYIDDTLRNVTVTQLAAEALSLMNSRGSSPN